MPRPVRPGIRGQLGPATRRADVGIISARLVRSRHDMATMLAQAAPLPPNRAMARTIRLWAIGTRPPIDRGSSTCAVNQAHGKDRRNNVDGAYTDGGEYRPQGAEAGDRAPDDDRGDRAGKPRPHRPEGE